MLNFTRRHGGTAAHPDFRILPSGALAQYGSLPACLWGSAAMLALCLTLVFLLPALMAIALAAQRL